MYLLERKEALGAEDDAAAPQVVGMKPRSPEPSGAKPLVLQECEAGMPWRSGLGSSGSQDGRTNRRRDYTRSSACVGAMGTGCATYMDSFF